MPEGDTVHRTADRLHRALAGEPLVLADLRWPSLATADLVGATTLEVAAKGKHLLHRLDRGVTVHSHLRMEGSWRVERPGPATARALRRADLRAAFGTTQWSALGLRLGMLDLVPTARESEVVGHLGPDVLDDDLDVPGALARIAAAPDRLIGDTLLDQRVVCGIGTFWASEGLFLARILPWTRVGDIEGAALERMLERVVRLMRHAAATGWQASTGVQRSGEEAYVHARSGRPCRRCGDTVRVALTGAAPRQRTMFSCPTCQGGLAPTDDGRAQRPLGSSGRGGSYRR